MKITTISKKTNLTNYLQSSFRDDVYFYEPQSLMIYHLLSNLSKYSLSSFSPELFNSMLENVKDNKKVQDELKNGIYIYKQNLGHSKLNIAQITLFSLGFPFFKFFNWNEHTYEKVKKFFSKSHYKKDNLEEFKNILKKEFTAELINPNINESNEAFYILDIQVALKILVELEKHFDIHELLKKDVSITYENKKILNSSPYTKEVSISAFSYILQNCYSIPSYTSFYNQNITNTPDPLSLCFAPTTSSDTYFRSPLSSQISAYDIMDKETYLQIINKFITDLKDNFNFLSSSSLTQYFFNKDLLNKINESNLDNNTKKDILFKFLNVSPKVLSIMEEGETNFFLLNTIYSLDDEKKSFQILDNYINHSKDNNKTDFIINSLTKGTWNKFSQRKLYKSDKILTRSFTSLPLLKKWFSIDNQEFDPEYKILNILLHFKSEIVLKEYLQVIDKHRYSEALEIIDKTLSSNKVLINIEPYTTDTFSSARIEKDIMKTDITPSTNKSRISKF